MVHELLGIHNGRVDLRMVPDINPELAVRGFIILFFSFSHRCQEITLTTSTDPFFQTHHGSTFGDLGTVLKEYVQNYQSKSLVTSPANIQSIADMKRFVEEYPEFRKLGGNVSKHVALVGELSRLVGRDKLLDVGEVEQGLATSAGADYKVCIFLIKIPAGSQSSECPSHSHRSGHSTVEQTQGCDSICAPLSKVPADEYCKPDQSSTYQRSIPRGC
jgi:hypothetical protein